MKRDSDKERGRIKVQIARPSDERLMSLIHLLSNQERLCILLDAARAKAIQLGVNERPELLEPCA